MEHTDLGIGIVTDLYRYADGSYPQSLEEMLPQTGITPPLKTAINEFKDWLRKDLFLTRHLLPHNIIVVKEAASTYRLVIVDGIGNSEMIPVSSWFDAFARRKIERKIAYFDYRVAELLE